MNFSSVSTDSIHTSFLRMGTKRKVSLLEVWFRLLIIVAPLIGPFLLDLSKSAKVAIPALWLICMGPIFLLPTKNIEDWEENAKPYYEIFQKIGHLYLGLIILSGIMFVLFGKTRY